MVIGLAKIVLCFYLCLCLARAYQESRDSFRRNDLYSRYQVTSRPMSPENRFRHSRYPKFGKVMTRIENFSEDVPVETSLRSVHNKFRHKGWGSHYRTTTTSTTTTTPSPLFDELTYGDEEDSSEYDDYDEEDEKDEAYLLFDTVADDIQAEEPTERSIIMSSKPVSSLTEYKWNNLGTMSRVEKSRQQQLSLRPEHLETNAFMEHFDRVSKETKCHKPIPKVISIRKEYPNLSKSYMPSCTILHRCAEDTGCCNKDTKCQYKYRELVPLYFYVDTRMSRNRYEKLEFYNHTECECRSTNEAPDGIPEDPAPEFPFTSTRQFNTPQTVKRCSCPALFQDARYSHKCACDCARGNIDCLQLKTGNEHFNILDRVCIADGNCGIPICEYGVYNMEMGRCPTKKDKLVEYSRVPSNFG